MPDSIPTVLLSFNLKWDGAEQIITSIQQHVGARWRLKLDIDGELGHTPDRILAGGWQGIITRHMSADFADCLAAMPKPPKVVDLHDSPRRSGTVKIRPDNQAIGRIAAQHFLQRGFQTFATVGNNDCWSLDRQRGFRQVLHAHGHAAQTIPSPPADFPFPETISEVRDLAAALHPLPRPIGLFATNDLLARYLVDAAQRLGYALPEDLAILGVNNDSLRCHLGAPALSSIDLNWPEIGRKAVVALDHLLAGTPPPGGYDQRVPPARVITRPSTDLLAVADPVVRQAVDLICAREGGRIHVDEVSAELRVSRNLLEKRFRKAFGESPHSWIRGQQILKAQHLLRDTDLPLKVVSHQLGIDHPEYFNVLFSKRVGISPGRYRQSFRASLAKAV